MIKPYGKNKVIKVCITLILVFVSIKSFATTQKSMADFLEADRYRAIYGQLATSEIGNIKKFSGRYCEIKIQFESATGNNYKIYDINALEGDREFCFEVKKSTLKREFWPIPSDIDVQNILKISRVTVLQS